MATIYEVAKAAGVSTSTVSRALRNDRRITERTRTLVEKAAQQLNYVPKMAAQVLAGSDVRVLGMVLPHIEGTYYSELVVGFETRASELDCSVVILQANRGPDRRTAIRRLTGYTDAVAFLAKSFAPDQLVADTALNRPVVTVARTELPGTPAIFAESIRSSEQLVSHLISNGRRRIAFAGPVDPGSDIEARYQGYTRAMGRAGLAAPSNIEVVLEEMAGRQLAATMVDDGLPYDAVVCGNDDLALALSHELQRRGVDVPGDVAVVGWDDVVAARYITPGLTTVKQPVFELGALAAETLHKLLKGEQVPSRMQLPTSIVHRQSCGCTVTQPPPQEEKS